MLDYRLSGICLASGESAHDDSQYREDCRPRRSTEFFCACWGKGIMYERRIILFIDGGGSLDSYPRQFPTSLSALVL